MVLQLTKAVVQLAHVDRPMDTVRFAVTRAGSLSGPCRQLAYLESTSAILLGYRSECWRSPECSPVFRHSPTGRRNEGRLAVRAVLHPVFHL